jgi:hypothetical protein
LLFFLNVILFIRIFDFDMGAIWLCDLAVAPSLAAFLFFALLTPRYC